MKTARPGPWDLRGVFAALLGVLLVVGGFTATAAQAATGSVTSVTLTPAEVYEGSSVRLDIGFALSDVGDTVTVTAPDEGFDVSNYNGKTIRNSSGVAIATTSVSGNVITITSLLSEVTGTASQLVKYTDEIEVGAVVPTTWTGPGTTTFTIPVTGIGKPSDTTYPAWFNPGKRVESQGWTDEGKYRIQWHVDSLAGGFSSVTFTDTAGAGVIPECSALIGLATVRIWDESNGTDQWVASLGSGDYTINDCSEVSGGSFSVTFDYNVPDPGLGAVNNGGRKVYYITFAYNSYAEESTIAPGAQWGNDVTVTDDAGGSMAKHADATINDVADGSRKITVSKALSGDVTTQAATAFPIRVQCVTGGEASVDQTLDVVAGTPQTLLVPLKSDCYATETNTHDATSVAITDGDGTAVSSTAPLYAGPTAVGPLELIVTNTFALGSASWSKTDAAGTALEGAGWTLTGPDGFSQTFAAGTDTSWTATDLNWGEYTLTESTVPAGYSGSPSTSFTIDGTRTDVDLGAIANTRVLGSASWSKTDGDGATLEGAGWTLTGPDGFSQVFDAGAETSWSVADLAWGDYTLTESTVPAGYTAAAPVSFSIDGTHLAADLGAIQNTQVLGSASWSKTDGDGAALEGAGWTLIGPAGFSQTFAAGTDTSWSVADLPWGDYTLTESTVPEGYTAAAPVSFTIDGTHLAADLGAIANTQVLGSASWSKTDGDGAALEGAGWTLTGPDGFSQTFAAGTDTSWTATDLNWGEYTLTESTVPDGYTGVAEPLLFTVDAAHPVTDLGAIANTQVLGSASWSKTDAAGAALEGAGWTLTGPDGFSQTFAAGAETSWSVADLAWGDYTLVESTVPAGYTAAAPVSFSIDGTHLVADLGAIANTQVRGSVSWAKTDATGAALAGAGWTLTGPDGFSRTFAAGAETSWSVADLAWGDYTLTESTVPEGYTAAAPVSFSIDGTHLAADLGAIANMQVLGSASWSKTDAAGTALAGAGWTLTGPDGFSQTFDAGADTSWSVADLAWGDYTLTESTVPAGYTAAAPVSFTIDATHLTADLGAIQNTLTPSTTSLGTASWSKTDAAGTALAGAGWTLTGPDGFSRTFAAGAQTSWSVADLAWGDYTLTESTVPEGYTAAAPVSFSIDGTHLAADLGAIQNTQVLGSASWSKTDAAGAALEGAGWTLTGPDGFSQTFAAGTDTSWTATDLAWGDYTLVESTVPEGYTAAAPVSFTIDASHLTAELGDVVNVKTAVSDSKTQVSDPKPQVTEQPNAITTGLAITGADSAWLIWIGTGLLLAGLSLGALHILARRRMTM